MLSEDAIEKLIAPILERQQRINLTVLLLIAKRIKEIGTLLPSDIYKLERLLKTGSDVRKINEFIAYMTGLQEKDIKRIIKVVAMDYYLDSKPFYDYRHKPFIPFKDNEQLQRVVNAIANQTANEYVNLSKAQAFMIRDLKNPKILKPTPLAEAYQSVIDEAVQITSMGISDYSSSIRRTIEQLVDSGIRNVTYNTESGRTYTQRLDTAVRRNVLDGVRAIGQGVQDEVGKQFGADGIELSVHRFPAPDHEPIQGHQFTMENYEKMQHEQPFVDIQGRKFPAMKRAIGTLNCRHFAWNIIIGHAKPNYTDEELQAIIDANHKGYTLPNGKHLTMYECTQKQRQYELAIRRAKEGQLAAETAGDKELAKKYKAKASALKKEYEAFSKACGLSTKPKNLSIVKR